MATKAWGPIYSQPVQESSKKALLPDEIRRKHFARLRNYTYLDYAGAALYSEIQMQEVAKLLSESLLVNPHSKRTETSSTSGEDPTSVDQLKERILELFFNTNSRAYSVIFTSGATAALKLVGESFPWGESSEFCSTMDSHTSVLGIRELARQKQAHFSCVDSKMKCVCSREMLEARNAKTQMQRSSDEEVFSLFAFPAESNFSGRRYPGSLVNRAVNGEFAHEDPSAKGSSHITSKWKVLVDTAKYCATSCFDLAAFPADFAILSFYKIFGYPTGLGCLIVKNETLPILTKQYFGGGSVDAIASNSFFRVARQGIEQWSDGTSHFLGISALPAGFTLVEKTLGGLEAIRANAMAITWFMLQEMLKLRHIVRDKQGSHPTKGSQVCEIYNAAVNCQHTKKPRTNARNLGIVDTDACQDCFRLQGPTIAFNIRKACGCFIGCSEIGKLASAEHILLRTGCFCNAGACQLHLDLSPENSTLLAKTTSLTAFTHFLVSLVQSNHAEAGHRCGDEISLVNGKPIGAVRISFGNASTMEDARVFLRFLKLYFVAEMQTEAQEAERLPSSCVLPDIGSCKMTCTACKTIPYKDITFNSAARDGRNFDNGLSASWEKDKEAQVEAELAIVDLIIYPIKSCGGFSIKRVPKLKKSDKASPNPAVQHWPLLVTGLKFDREWVVATLDGVALTQKRVSRMAGIRTAVYLAAGVMKVFPPSQSECEKEEPLLIALYEQSYYSTGLFVEAARQVGFDLDSIVKRLLFPVYDKICEIKGNVRNGGGLGHKYPSLANEWFSRVLGISCIFVRKEGVQTLLSLPFGGMKRKPKLQASGTSSFSNAGSLLLVSMASIRALQAAYREDNISPLSVGGSSRRVENFVSTERFRPNIVVDQVICEEPQPRGMTPLQPYDEDSWSHVTCCPSSSSKSSMAGNFVLKVSQPCSRCIMVNINQQTGMKDSKLFTLLARKRRSKQGPISFGVLLSPGNLRSMSEKESSSDEVLIGIGTKIDPFRFH